MSNTKSIKKLKADSTTDEITTCFISYLPNDILFIILCYCFDTLYKWSQMHLVCKRWRSVLALSDVFMECLLFNDKCLIRDEVIDVTKIKNLWEKLKHGRGLSDRIVWNRMDKITPFRLKTDMYNNMDMDLDRWRNIRKEESCDTQLRWCTLLSPHIAEVDFMTNIKFLLEPYGLSTWDLHRLIFTYEDVHPYFHVPFQEQARFISPFTVHVGCKQDFFIDEDDNRCILVSWWSLYDHNMIEKDMMTGGTEDGIGAWIILLRLQYFLGLLGVKCRLDTADFPCRRVDAQDIINRNRQDVEDDSLDGVTIYYYANHWSVLRVPKQKPPPGLNEIILKLIETKMDLYWMEVGISPYTLGPTNWASTIYEWCIKEYPMIASDHGSPYFLWINYVSFFGYPLRYQDIEKIATIDRVKLQKIACDIVKKCLPPGRCNFIVYSRMIKEKVREMMQRKNYEILLYRKIMKDDWKERLDSIKEEDFDIIRCCSCRRLILDDNDLFGHCRECWQPFCLMGEGGLDCRHKLHYNKPGCMGCKPDEFKKYIK